MEYMQNKFTDALNLFTAQQPAEAQFIEHFSYVPYSAGNVWGVTITSGKHFKIDLGLNTVTEMLITNSGDVIPKYNADN